MVYRPELRWALDGLDELSVANLKCGRITREAMHFAVQKAMKDPNWRGYEIGIRSRLPTHSEMILADVLNDMLEAATQEDPDG